MKKLLLYQQAHEPHLYEYIANIHQQDDVLVILEVNAHVDSSLLHENIFFRQFENYITDKELLAMEQDIRYFSQEWYTIDKENMTLYDDISFGEAMELEFLEFFTLLLTGVTYAFRAISEERPVQILLFRDHCFLQNIFLYVCTTWFRDIQVEFLETSAKHDDYIERQNPALSVSPTSSQSSSEAEIPRIFSRQSIFQWVSIVWQKCLIETADLSYKLFEKYRIPKTLLIVSDVRHFDLISRLRKTSSYRILSEIRFSRSDYKHLARTQAKAHKIFNSRWAHVQQHSALRNFFLYDPYHPGTTHSASLSAETCPSQKYNLWEFIAPRLHNMFAQHLNSLIEWMHTFRRWAQKENLALIVLDIPYTIPHRRVWSLAARKLEIPTVGLLEGPFHKVVSNGNAFLTPITDHIATWGKASTEMALSQGFQEEQVHVIGEHHLEELAQETNNTDSVALKNELNIEDGKRIVTFTPTGVPAWTAIPIVTMLDKQDILKAVCAASQELLKYHFIIKFHPNTDYYEGDGTMEKKVKFVNSYRLDNMAVMTSRKRSISKVFSITDLLIAIDGTTGLEAIYFDKPLIILNFRQRHYLAAEFVSSGAAVLVERSEDLPQAIENVFTKPEVAGSLKRGRELFLQKYITAVPHYHTIIENLAKQ